MGMIRANHIRQDALRLRACRTMPAMPRALPSATGLVAPSRRRCRSSSGLPGLPPRREPSLHPGIQFAEVCAAQALLFQRIS